MSIKRAILLLFISCSLLYGNPFQTSDAPKLRNPGVVNRDLVELQLEFRQMISSSIKSIKNGEGGLFILILSALIYGLLHAAGPGHRKSVLFTIFLSNKSKWWEPITAGGISGGVHGISAIVIVYIFSLISRKLLSARVGEASTYIEIVSFILLISLSLFFIIKKLFIKEGRDNFNSKGRYLPTIVATSIFPCPAAVLILILSLSLNLFYIGVIGVIFLSMGMGITISLVAIIGRSGRVGIYRSLRGKENRIKILSDILEVGGYIVLILFSLWMLSPIF